MGKNETFCVVQVEKLGQPAHQQLLAIGRRHGDRALQPGRDLTNVGDQVEQAQRGRLEQGGEGGSLDLQTHVGGMVENLVAGLWHGTSRKVGQREVYASRGITAAWKTRAPPAQER